MTRWYHPSFLFASSGATTDSSWSTFREGGAEECQFAKRVEGHASRSCETVRFGSVRQTFENERVSAVDRIRIVPVDVISRRRMIDEADSAIFLFSQLSDTID